MDVPQIDFIKKANTSRIFLENQCIWHIRLMHVMYFRIFPFENFQKYVKHTDKHIMQTTYRKTIIVGIRNR
jgi:hypothetical protein